VSIVEDRPGVTRDRLYADTEVMDKPVTVVDMGGWEVNPEGEIEEGINRQCRKGLESAALVLFVVDGREPPTNGDYETAQLLRRSGTPVILVVNKMDGERQEAEAGDIFSLGMDNPIMISALHGRGISNLEDEMYRLLPRVEPVREDSDDVEDDFATRVAIIGRPNAGKSSLINKLLNEERLLTMDKPGTTRDSVDTLIERDGKRYVFVDTAGIRKKNRVPRIGPEHMAVSAAVKAMERCRVVVLMLDAASGVAEQDAKVLGLAVDRNRAVVIALNKWDLLKGDSRLKKELTETTRDILAFVPWAEIVNISALRGTGLSKLFNAIDSAHAEFCKRVPTGKLNALFQDIVDHHPPPLRKGRPVKLYYATQASVRPPTFVVKCSYPEALHFSYRRYIQNRIRESFGFKGSPVRIIFKKRACKGDTEP
jgi:GTP-binding protein